MQSLFKKGLFLLASLSILLLVVAPICIHSTYAQSAAPSSTLSAKIQAEISKGAASINPFKNAAVNSASFGSSFFKTLGIYLLSLGALAASAALDFNAIVVQLPTVQIGFSVALALANLGFVLGIIIIAIATILRIDNYGLKQILWKLIVMAILINFSMVIAGSLLTFTDSLTGYFMKSATTGGFNDPKLFISTLVNGFEPNRLIRPPANADAAGTLSSAIQYMLGGLTSGLFLFLIAFVLFAAAAMFVIRGIFLTFLLILMPLAWLAWVFPLFHQNWEKWWREFLRWSFFAPACVFFLYLTVAVAQNVGGNNTIDNIAASNGSTIGAIGTGQEGASADALAAMTASAGTGLLDAAIRVILLFGLAVGGLFAANSFGIQGASTAINLAKSAPGLAYRGTRNTGVAAGNFVGARVGDYARNYGSKYDPIRKEVTTRGQRVGSALQGIPGFQTLGSRIAAWATPQHGREEEVKKYADTELKALSYDGLVARARNANPISSDTTELAALAGEIARRDAISDVPPAQMRVLMQAAEVTESEGPIFANRPDLAFAHRREVALPTPPGGFAANAPRTRQETDDEVAQRILKDVKDASNINKGQLGTPNGVTTPTQQAIVFNLNATKINQIEDPGKQEAIRSTILSVWGPLKTQLEEAALAEFAQDDKDVRDANIQVQNINDFRNLSAQQRAQVESMARSKQRHPTQLPFAKLSRLANASNLTGPDLAAFNRISTVLKAINSSHVWQNI